MYEIYIFLCNILVKFDMKKSNMLFGVVVEEVDNRVLLLLVIIRFIFYKNVKKNYVILYIIWFFG